MAVTDWKNGSSNPANSGSGIANPTNVYASDNAYAVIADITSTSDIGNFGNFGIPSDQKIDGIEVQVEAKYTGSGVNRSIAVRVFSSSGGGFSSSKSASVPSTTDSSVILGSSTDKWGRSWTFADFADGIFKIQFSSSSLSVTSIDVDQILVRVHYSLASPITFRQNRNIRPSLFVPGRAK